MEKKNKIIMFIMVVLLVILASISTYLIYDKYYRATDNEDKVAENSYTIFSQNFKKELSKYDKNNYNYQIVTNQIIEDGYAITLNEKGSLYVKYFNKELNDKYGTYKLADNVLSFYVINDGQNFGNMLYFINEDGTVGKADTEYRMNNNISVIKDIGYKNIVSIISGTFGDDYTGTHGPIFIDINGNLFSESFK